jgi:EthD domain
MPHAYYQFVRTGEGTPMIRLTAMLRRNPALTADEFQAHWRDVHAAKIVSVLGVRDRLVRYEQHPRLATGPDGWAGTEGFDGMAVQWYRSVEDFMAMTNDPGYRETVAPDERQLLDLAGGVYLLTDQPRVIIGEGSAH